MEKISKQKVTLLFFLTSITKMAIQILDDNLTLRNDRAREQWNQRDTLSAIRTCAHSYHLKFHSKRYEIQNLDFCCRQVYR